MKGPVVRIETERKAAHLPYSVSKVIVDGNEWPVINASWTAGAPGGYAIVTLEFEPDSCEIVEVDSG